ncbi:palmitoyltransferase ZDHHC6-like [Drosophila miranda]|uniref:palmitoyltransferase ZDHHC6-like n=1 Tax=Drosophila miranda TaxID=7229 RepID=UPI00143F3D79|nr:palmitoyltransferase ZDHHC6-like [Drosophila miranda]
MFCDWLNELQRFLHWGPLIVFSLMTCVTWTTVHVNAMWWPPAESFNAAINFVLIVLLNLITLYHFCMSIVVGPGLLPKHWRPENPEDEQFLQFCKVCDGYKAPRAHHCRRCKRCVLRMDHHCPWINNCIGWANQANFFYFLFFFMLGSIQSALIIGFSCYEGIYRRALLKQGDTDGIRVVMTLRSAMACMYSLGIVVGVLLATFKLMQLQIKAIIWNLSEIEGWIVKKAEYRRYASSSIGIAIPTFDYPYDMGVWRNILETFTPSGDGINWPVRPGCDQYTMTREQLAQKEQKRARTRTYRCIASATGYWLPIFSQGLMATICMPCADDPRIVVHKGDLVQVTRVQEYWLYGERVLSKREQKLQKKHQLKGHIRGWFPRCCAVEQFDEDQSAGDTVDVNHNTDQKKTKTGSKTKKRKTKAQHFFP